MIKNTQPILFAAALLASCAPLPQATDPWKVGELEKSISADAISSRHTVYFDTDSATLSASEANALVAYARSLERNSSLTLQVAGHADERASDRYNMALSARRAGTVEQLLRDVGLRHIDTRVVALGERAPAAAGASRESYARNRRVELFATSYTFQIEGCTGQGLDLMADHSNLPDPEMGCANLENFAAMVDDPRDLLSSDVTPGGPTALPDGDHQYGAVDRYRKNEIPDLDGEGSGT